MTQLDLFAPAAPQPTPQVTRFEQAELTYWPGCFAADADRWFAALDRDTPWHQDNIRMFGRWVPIPRENAWYGDPDSPYTYSGNPMTPHPWTPLLQEIRSRVEALAGETYNSVLLNRYRDGQDSVDWHADDEPELMPRHTIASVSLGGIRKFRLRHRDYRDRHDLPKPEFQLGHGDLLIMGGATQEYWQHQVPRTARPVPPRINLTFRWIRTPVRSV